MNWLGQSDEQMKKSILQTLIKLSKVDGEVNGKELMYLLDLGKIYGMTTEQIREMLYAHEASLTVPSSEKDRMTILYLLLFLMKIDGKATDKEENLIYHYGFMLGFNEALVRELILTIKSHLGKKLPPNELLDRVKKYLN